MTQSADEFRAETLVAIDAVKRAVTIARRDLSTEDITAKGGRDLVTVADVAIEDAVRGIVADALGFAMIGEERGGEASADGSPYVVFWASAIHAGAGSLSRHRSGRHSVRYRRSTLDHPLRLARCPAPILLSTQSCALDLPL